MKSDDTKNLQFAAQIKKVKKFVFLRILYFTFTHIIVIALNVVIRRPFLCVIYEMVSVCQDKIKLGCTLSQINGG